MLIVEIFFASRRRHTRLQGDWSSDVCSSDLWIAGQANWISQRHPEVRSPYQGPRSLSPQAQHATSRVLTLFAGVRLTNTNELICVQETDDDGIGEAVGLAGGTNLDIVRNPDLSKAP